MDLLGFRRLPIEVVAHAAVLLQQPVHGDALFRAVAEVPIQSAHDQDLAVGQLPDFVIGALGLGALTASSRNSSIRIDPQRTQDVPTPLQAAIRIVADYGHFTAYTGPAPISISAM